jgi:subtilisin family serine protease
MKGIAPMKKMFFTILLAVLAGTAAQAGELAPVLQAQIDGMEDHEVLKVLVVMRDQANVASLNLDLHDRQAPLAVRHNTVVTSLRDVAAVSQKDLLGDLRYREADKAAGGVRGFTPHWIVNSIVLVAEVGVIREIAAREDVAVVEADLEVELIEPVMTKFAADKGLDSPQEGGFLAPGVEMVNAPRVWRELGFDGTGTIVANLDSGVDGSHDLLLSRWRGSYAPASECWRDLADVGSPDFPADPHGHGTHTMGTITGASVNDTTGVAPGALWISSNAVYAGSSTDYFDNAIIAAFEFFADPDGDPTTSDEVPDVVQNSWGTVPNPVLGYTPCDSRWWDAIDNCEAAGVVVTWSAGNEGPGKGTLRSPGDRASSPTNCFSIGSVGYDIPYVVSSFSSRGPSACGGEYSLKPEVVAPGEDILSTLPGNNYGYMSGTSMAGPHVAGIVALMRQANPDMDVIDIKQILMDTAIDVGSPGQDNASGHGMVDAYEAVFAAMTEKGEIRGVVTDSATGSPLPGVEVRRAGYPTAQITDAAGFYSLAARSGPVEVEFSKFSYTPQTHALNLAAGETMELDVPLVQRPVGTLSGVVYGPTGQPVKGATVRIVGVDLDPVITEHYGNYAFELPVYEDASYEIVASAPDLAYVVEYVGLPESRVLDIHLPSVQAEGFENGALTAFSWVTGGVAPMYVDASEAQEGVFSVRSGNIGDLESSEISLDYYVAGDGEISFYLKTECEDTYDGLYFYVDGLAMGRWTGERDWTRVSIPVSAGQHNFKWTYSKDYAVSVKRDAAWIDRIEFPGTGQAPAPQLVADQTNVVMTFHAAEADSTDLNLMNTGNYPLEFSTRVADFPVNGSYAADDLVGMTPTELVNKGILAAADKSGGPTWVSVSPAAGTIYPGVGKDLNIRFDATAMTDGTYYAMLDIFSNDPDTPAHSVPLIMTLASVSGVQDPVLPGRVELAGAVPNPFNPMTHITYSMPMAGEVTLRIYDVSGRLIRDLASGLRSAGRHQEKWDGTNQQGRDVASGIYFARLTVEGQMQMKSMLLLR